MNSWPKDKEDRLRVLWLQGMSCAQIGKLLGKSKNAVGAKVDRMGLPERLEPNRHAKRVTRAAKPTQRISLAPSSSKEPEFAGGARKTKRSIRFEDHRDFRDCARFCEGESGARGFVCGAPCAPGHTYCRGCLKDLYRPLTAVEKAMLRRRAA